MAEIDEEMKRRAEEAAMIQLANLNPMLDEELLHIAEDVQYWPTLTTHTRCYSAAYNLCVAYGDNSGLLYGLFLQRLDSLLPTLPALAPPLASLLDDDGKYHPHLLQLEHALHPQHVVYQAQARFLVRTFSHLDRFHASFQNLPPLKRVAELRFCERVFSSQPGLSQAMMDEWIFRSPPGQLPALSSLPALSAQFAVWLSTQHDDEDALASKQRWVSARWGAYKLLNRQSNLPLDVILIVCDMLVAKQEPLAPPPPSP